MEFEWWMYFICGLIVGFLLSLIIIRQKKKIATVSLEFKQIEDLEIMQWNLPLEPKDIKKQKQIIFDVRIET